MNSTFLFETFTSPALIVGFATSLGLILAIGAQNAFVMRCGMKNLHVFWVCTLCAFFDALLIALGVVGLGKIAEAFPSIAKIALWLGVGFLLVYGGLRFKAFLNPPSQAEAEEIPSLRKTLLITLAFTLLNPHVYLDTVFLLGAIAIPYDTLAGKTAFIVGASSASLSFFFSLGYGARLLGPIFSDPKRWRYIELCLGIVMFIIAIQLMLHG